MSSSITWTLCDDHQVGGEAGPISIAGWGRKFDFGWDFQFAEFAFLRRICVSEKKMVNLT